MEIRRLTEADVPAALGLSTQAGWNQIGADWHRLLALTPDHCYAGWVDGELVATTTVTTYDTGGGWVGMVLVDENHQRQGYGTQILEHAIEAAAASPDVTIGLDATEQGRPLYEDYGFEAVRDITRLSGTIEPVGDGSAVEIVTDSFDAAVTAYDQAACGTDRTTLLDVLLEEDDTVIFVSHRDESVDGYAVLRPGRDFWQLGPVVTDRDDVLATLLDAAGTRLAGDRVLVDSLADDDQTAMLHDRGLEPQRELTRMTYPDSVPLLTSDSVVAAAGLELG